MRITFSRSSAEKGTASAHRDKMVSRSGGKSRRFHCWSLLFVLTSD